MREILFRGKPVERFKDFLITRSELCKDGFVLGSLVQCENRTYICTWAVCSHMSHINNATSTMVEVIPETVGQWAGYTDMNGQKIFEGDIVRTRKNGVRTEKLKGYFGVDSDGYPQRVPGYTGTSEYHYNTIVDCCAEVKYGWHGFYLEGTTTFVNAICNEIISNIHDNPELLKGE